MGEDLDLVNLTPHEVTIVGANGRQITLPRAEVPARVQWASWPAGLVTAQGVPISVTITDERAASGAEVTGLPPERPGVGYIVARVVCHALPERRDLYAPGELLRDDAGRPVGAVGLYMVPPEEA